MRERSSTSLVVSSSPEQDRLDWLQSTLDARRDEIAVVDLALEDLQRDLARFEAALEIRLAFERDRLSRVDLFRRHLHRWTVLLDQGLPEQVPRRASRLAARHAEELEDLADLALEGPRESDPGDRDTRLKSVYRAMARRFHPDLAGSEAEQVEFGRLMVRINDLYHVGDLDRLLDLAERAKGGEIDEGDVPLGRRIEILEARLVHFDLALDNLRAERDSLERHPSCELFRNHQQEQHCGRDLIEELRNRLQRRLRDEYASLRPALGELEAAVARYNRRRSTTTLAVATEATPALRFDSRRGRNFAQLALSELSARRDDPARREEADRLEVLAKENPAHLRLILLARVAELSPFPLPGLERFDDLELRFAHLGRRDPQPAALDETLVALQQVLEYGVRRATEHVAHLGLRLHDDVTRGALTLAVKRPAVSAVFREVLSVLGERVTCAGCRQDVFAVPLLRTRGLDDLRANVCPTCGTTASRYWLPKGQDMQAVLNEAYLDLEIVTEWSFCLGRGRFAIQLLPVEVDAMSVGDLKRQLHDDLFVRYDLGVRRGQLRLHAQGRRVVERTPLAELGQPRFEVRFAGDVAMTEAMAYERLRYRARHRFQEGPAEAEKPREGRDE